MSNPVIDCLMNHRSIRKFKDQPIAPETLDTLLKAGTRAATAGGLQHYSLVVVDDPAVKLALDDEGDPESFVSTAPLIIVSLVDEFRFKRWVELNDAPFYFNHITNLLIGFWDAIIALHNIVIAAESLGLGTVYIGTVISVDAPKVLGTPQYVFPAGMVCLGYPDENPPQRPRLPLDAVVHRNRYHCPTDDEVRAFHAERDHSWFERSEEWRSQWIAQGIHNQAQRVTLGHYTQEFLAADSRGALRTLNTADFKLTEE